jgi:hypothetical protein
MYGKKPRWCSLRLAREFPELRSRLLTGCAADSTRSADPCIPKPGDVRVRSSDTHFRGCWQISPRTRCSDRTVCGLILFRFNGENSATTQHNFASDIKIQLSIHLRHIGIAVAKNCSGGFEAELLSKLCCGIVPELVRRPFRHFRQPTGT